MKFWPNIFPIFFGLAAMAPAEDVKRVQASSGGGGAMMGSRNTQGAGWVLPEEVDRKDPMVRVLMFLPDRAVLIELAVKIDGQPFRTYREKHLDEIFESIAGQRTLRLKKDRSTAVRWVEALKNPHFSNGHYVASGRTGLEQLEKRYDSDGDGMVDRSEARHFLAANSGGPALVVTPNLVRSGSLSVLPFIDADSDKQLSRAEIEAVGELLRRKDTNGDEVIDSAELSGTQGNRGVVIRKSGGGMVQGGAANRNQELFAIYEGADWKEILKREAALPAALDADGDKKISDKEVRQLLTFPPDISLEVNLGKDKGAQGLVVRKPEAYEGEAVFAFPSGRLNCTIGSNNITLTQRLRQNSTFKAYLTRYDKDKNGYLEAAEMKTDNGQANAVARQFVLWDRNGDGKVYPKEYQEWWQESQERQWNRVSLSLSQGADPIYTAIDSNGDGRIGAREIKNANRTLKALDGDNDGKVTASEMPRNMKLTVARGSAGSGSTYVSQRGAAPVGSSSGPAWFDSMDHNRDGDVSPREFLGTVDQFRKLDSDGDGFIDGAEAKPK